MHSVASIWLTIDAFRWALGAKDVPFSVISSLWKGGLDNLSLAERQALRDRYRSTLYGIGKIPWLFASVSVAFVVITIREFAG